MTYADIERTELAPSERETLHRLAFEVDWAVGILIKSALWNLEQSEQGNERLREALRIALDAMRRSADDHGCDYCRADIAAVERALGEQQA